MAWRETLSGLIRRPAGHYVYQRIPPARITIPSEERKLESGQCYLRVKLVQMFLGDERVWYQKRAPVVHAYPRFLNHDGYLEVPVIVGPTRFKELSEQQYQRIVSMDQTVLGPVPYLGGEFDLTLALFSAQTQDHARQFLDLLGSITDVAAVTGLSAARELLNPLKHGLDGMLGLGDIELRVGIQQTFSSSSGGDHIGKPLSSGYWALIASEGNKIGSGELWITERGLCRGLSNGLPGELLRGCDYLVFQLERLDQRDWRELPILNAAWSRVEKAIEIGDENVIDRAFNLFKWAVLGSGDLIPPDRIAVLKEQVMVVRELVDAGTVTVRNLFPGEQDVSGDLRMIIDRDFGEAANIDWKM